jgi:hypothetical protein
MACKRALVWLAAVLTVKGAVALPVTASVNGVKGGVRG